MEKNTSIETFIKDQIERWKTQTQTHIPVITVSSQPGSGGRVIAKGLAKRLCIDLFDREWIRQLVLDSLDLMLEECESKQRMDLWEIFRLRIVEPVFEEKEPLPYDQLVRQLDIQSPRQAINLLVTAKRCFLRNLRLAIGNSR